MRVSGTHNLPKQELKDRLESEIPGLLAQFGDAVSDVRHSWDGNQARVSFRARGMSIKGTLTVTDTAVDLDVKLPFLAKMFEGAIRGEAERWMEEFLQK